jgi:DNA ligase-4
LTDSLDDNAITHVVLVGGDPMQTGEQASSIREKISSRRKVPRIVSETWVEDSWREKTLIDEEQFAVP